MPELPDVELFKRHLDATCLGRTIRRVIVSDARILAGVSASELAQRLEAARITKSLRHGKHLLVHLGPPGWLTMHFGMNGSLSTSKMAFNALSMVPAPALGRACKLLSYVSDITSS